MRRRESPRRGAPAGPRVFLLLLLPALFSCNGPGPASTTGSAADGTAGDRRIDVYRIEHCRNTPRALEVVRSALREAGLDAEIREHVVVDLETARRVRMIGSPTIQIRGVDIDPRVRGSDRYGFA